MNTLSATSASHYASATPASIVTENLRTAAVFEQFGIDFCCKGKLPLTQVCNERGIDIQELAEALTQAEGSADTVAIQEPNSLSPERLMTEIIEEHHTYVRRAIPVIQAHLGRVVERHGEHYPEVPKIARLFDELSTALMSHLLKEENVLFPYITALWRAKLLDGVPPSAVFDSVAFPIGVMETDHDHAGETMATIRRLSHNYTPPEGACNTFRAAYQELREFEEDLHKHVHKENNILHPKALALEQELAAR
jgi:regulator of cell morphogenesis and NO signaling